MKLFPFKSAINTSTLRPFDLNVEKQIEIAAKAGYDGIELWLADIKKYLNDGGTIQQLHNVLQTSRIEFVNTIAFFEWSDIDSNKRGQVLKVVEKDMQLLSDLGCQAIAAPPFGNTEGVSLDDMAKYFAELVKIGRDIGVEPYLEFWGKSKLLSRLSEAVYVLLESGVNQGKILIDPFHMYIGGSFNQSLEFIKGSHIGIFHVNDYPFSSSQEKLEDKDRVFPGEGIAPSKDIAQLLYQNGFKGYVSLELFKEHYDEMNAMEVAKYGLKCIKEVYQVSTIEKND